MDFADRERPRPRMNIAPLIDVVFLMLIFFMLTSTFIDTASIDLSMSRSGPAAGAGAGAGDMLLVDVKRDGELRLNGLTLGLDDLGPELAARAGAKVDTPVALRAEARVPVQRLVAVMDSIQGVGMSNIRLATPEAR